MMAKPSQIDRAIDQLEQEKAVIQLAIDKLRIQQQLPAALRRMGAKAKPRLAATDDKKAG